MSFLSSQQCCVTSRKEILAPNLLKLSMNKIKAKVSSLNPATSHMNWSQISCWSNLNPSDSTSICLINTYQNEHVVLHVMSHDSSRLNMPLTSLWRLTVRTYLDQHGVWKKLLAWQAEHSFCKNSFDTQQPNKNHCCQIVFGKTQDFKLHFSLIPSLVEFNYKSDLKLNKKVN